MKTITEQQIKSVFQKYKINECYIYNYNNRTNNEIQFQYDTGNGISASLIDDLSRLFDSYDYIINHHSNDTIYFEIIISKELLKIKNENS